MAFQTPRGKREKEDQKTTHLFSGGQFKYLVGLILNVSRKGSSFGGLSREWSLDLGSSREGAWGELPYEQWNRSQVPSLPVLYRNSNILSKKLSFGSPTPF